MSSSKNESLADELLRVWNREMQLMQRLMQLESNAEESATEESATLDDRLAINTRSLAEELAQLASESKALRERWGDAPLPEELSRKLACKRQIAEQAVAAVSKTISLFRQAAERTLLDLAEVNKTTSSLRKYAN